MSKKTLNKVNLSGLGAERLADLLMEVSEGSADIKRRLRLELSHDLGPQELGRDVRKRLVSLRRSKSYIGWRKRKALIKDLQTQVEMICDKVGPDDPTLAFDLLWQFMEIAPSIYERTDDSRGDIGDVFRNAIQGFGDLSPHATFDPVVLADRVWGVASDNGYGEFDGIIGLVAPALGDVGFEHLKSRVAAYAAQPLVAAEDDHDAILFLRELRGSQSSYHADQKVRLVKMVLQDIAIAEGDNATYVAQYSEEDLKRPDIAAEVAKLWISNGKLGEALDLLEAADLEGQVGRLLAWDDAYIACLLAMERMEDAQAHRWARFYETLNSGYLRTFIKALADFEDIEALDQARGHALAFPDAMTALSFFLDWPDHVSASALVLDRIDALDGDHYGLLAPAAEALRTRHPLAAVLLWRAMINFALHHGRATRYGHTAEHLRDCAALDAEISDYGGFLTHQEYLAEVRTRHDHKASFWSRVEAG